MTSQLPFQSDQGQLEQRAAAFDERHPEVFALVERFVLQAAAAGRRRIGIGAVWERIRWYYDVELDTREHFKLNNSHRAYYARRFIAAHPEHAELFETRRLRSRAWTN